MGEIMIGRLAVLAVFGSCSIAQADNLHYTNARFGTSAQLPALDLIATVSQNGDGITIEYADRKGRVSVYGGHNIEDNGLKGYRKALQSYYADITYQAGGKSWFVLSGYEGGQIFYVRVEGCDQGPMHHMYFEFPQEDKRAWQPVIEQYAKTLDGPCG